MTNDVAYVTQEMWDRAQAALRAALPVIEQHTPPLSTAGTMVSLRDQVRAAIIGSVVEPKAEPLTQRQTFWNTNYLWCEIHKLNYAPDMGGCPRCAENRPAEPSARCRCGKHEWPSEATKIVDSIGQAHYADQTCDK